MCTSAQLLDKFLNDLNAGVYDGGSVVISVYKDIDHHGWVGPLSDDELLWRLRTSIIKLSLTSEMLTIAVESPAMFTGRSAGYVSVEDIPSQSVFTVAIKDVHFFLPGDCVLPQIMFSDTSQKDLKYWTLYPRS